MSLDFIGFSLVTVVSFVFEKSYPVKNGRTRKIKTELPHGNSVRFAKQTPAGESYETGTTLAACRPLGPSSTENSTFCSASNLR